MPSKKAVRKARKRQKQKAKRKEKQEAMELKREMDEWAQTTYDQLLQEVFLDQGISRQEAWDIIQEAKQERKKNIKTIRAVEKMRCICEKAQLFEAACKEIKKTTHLHSPESMATLQHFFGGDGERIVKADDGESLLYLF
tara:strand:- start:420 stop:839 length:420 start_codon:yes stop_codon:yes gene_type:complete